MNHNKQRLSNNGGQRILVFAVYTDVCEYKLHNYSPGSVTWVPVPVQVRAADKAPPPSPWRSRVSFREVYGRREEGRRRLPVKIRQKWLKKIKPKLSFSSSAVVCNPAGSSPPLESLMNKIGPETKQRKRLIFINYKANRAGVCSVFKCWLVLKHTHTHTPPHTHVVAVSVFTPDPSSRLQKHTLASNCSTLPFHKPAISISSPSSVLLFIICLPWALWKGGKKGRRVGEEEERGGGLNRTFKLQSGDNSSGCHSCCNIITVHSVGAGGLGLTWKIIIYSLNKLITYISNVLLSHMFYLSSSLMSTPL